MGVHLILITTLRGSTAGTKTGRMSDFPKMIQLSVSQDSNPGPRVCLISIVHLTRSYVRTCLRCPCPSSGSPGLFHLLLLHILQPPPANQHCQISACPFLSSDLHSYLAIPTGTQIEDLSVCTCKEFDLQRSTLG